MVGLIGMKQKKSASVGYCINYMTLTFDLTCDLNLEFFQGQILNGFITGIVGLIDVKWKWIKSTGYWTNYVTFLFDHTHDLGIDFSRLKIFLNSLISGMWRMMKGMWIDHSDMSILLTHVIFIEQGVYFLWCTVGHMATQKVNSLRSCVSEWVIIGSENVLLPVGCQAII